MSGAVSESAATVMLIAEQLNKASL